MKKLYITLALAFIGTFSFGQTYKKIVVTKGSGKDTLLQVVETKTTTDTLDRKFIKAEIERFQSAKKAGLESIAIQTKLNAYYQSEIDRLKLLKAKTD